ncbi:DUF3566 domain-containing protein [Streptomyces purpurascens]|uniref:DUF3566 domain-containing protein n=1 Tax=Streptomyces purpurascens TaxID=1924 RepID=A0ABZ1MN89_STREF|nr:DUF3566 domain-containing protein [Streptomyces purpurascens]MCE7046604.1 DUF3566 domain-containing protein [Streptomyces purpurascens]GHA41885.1 hypothetical protein GCM10010303_61230 [Streptomyces purpurascens]
MSGATGAGPSGTSRGTDTDDGGRGSAARAADPHTTNLKAVKPTAKDDSPSPDTHGSQGGTVTDTRGPQTQQHSAGAGPAASGAQPQPQPQGAAQEQGTSHTASPLPGERQAQQQAGPYHPPQAYPAQQAAAGAGAGASAGAVRRPRTGAARTVPRVRKARLRVSKADPWSVMKVSFLLSIALGICTIVASAVLWMVMDAMGVFSTVGGTISEATGSNESNGFDLQAFLSLPNVLMFTSVIAVIDVVLATALATLGAFIYNLSAGFVGGVELTLAEDE